MPFCPWSQCLKPPFQLPCVCSLHSPHPSTLSYYHQVDHHHSPPHLIDDPCSFVREWRAFFTFTSSAIFLLVFICNSLLRSAGGEFRFQIKTVGNGKRDKDSYRKRQRERERERCIREQPDWRKSSVQMMTVKWKFWNRKWIGHEPSSCFTKKKEKWIWVWRPK